MGTGTLDIVFQLDKKATLKQQIEMLGIPTLSPEAVTEHKRKMLRTYRYGARRIIGPLFVVIQHLLGLFTAHTQGMIWARYRAYKLPPGVWLSTAVFLVVLPALAALAIPMSWRYGLLILPLLALLAAKAINKIVSRCFLLSEATSRWITVRVTANGENSSIVDLPLLPVHLQRRAERASQISGVRTTVDYLHLDPFLVAERGVWPFIERVTIGAWNTHRPEFDNA
ncbi:MAG: hypothetical protein KGI71_02325 [Patescibacteria group bacterium]|nr:hypothetical protein [Patescibacteria group bacterium]